MANIWCKIEHLHTYSIFSNFNHFRDFIEGEPVKPIGIGFMPVPWKPIVAIAFTNRWLLSQSCFLLMKDIAHTDSWYRQGEFVAKNLAM